MDLRNPFETFERSAFRVEGLPRYSVPEEKDSLASFKETGLISKPQTDWAETVRKNISAGKKIERLRLLSRHLSEYERYELQAYDGPRAGEEIHTATREEFLDHYVYDFWFFDDQWIMQMKYKDDGTFISYDVRLATDEEIKMYTYWRSVFKAAKPLRQVPFIANTADDTHCLQAAYMSVAQYFDSHFDIPMQEWSDMTGYEKDLGTWANAGPVWFKEHGYDVKHYEVFDFDEFIRRPKEYMLEVHGEEAGIWGYEHTNVPAEIVRMKKMIEAHIVEKREPTIEDIKQCIDDGYLVRVTLNAGTLDGIDEYVGHAVVVTDYNDSYIQFHDPGLPPIPNRQVTFNEFNAAWSDQAKELDAIRLLK